MIRRVLFVITMFLAATASAGPATMGGDPAQRMASMVAGQELAANDPRVVQANSWIKQVAKASGEDESFIATTCMKVAHYLYDITKVRAQPLEVLEALAKYAPPGKPIGDTSARYVAARRASADKTHAAAMAALAKP